MSRCPLPSPPCFSCNPGQATTLKPLRRHECTAHLSPPHVLSPTTLQPRRFSARHGTGQHQLGLLQQQAHRHVRRGPPLRALNHSLQQPQNHCSVAPYSFDIQLNSSMKR
ncbi:hypothetical protein SESBI_25805 [Sesbania bispinosa]|nr:hypothetical protein SESBI_25805 [Sesbania bispinosa]